MELFEFTNEEWEEHIKYYHALKSELSKEMFIGLLVRKNELNADIETDKCRTIDNDELYGTGDFNLFLSEKNITESNFSACIIGDEWYNEVIFIESANRCILRVRETSA